MDAVLREFVRKRAGDRCLTYRGAHSGGKTPVGRTTLSLLRMNDADRVYIRSLLLESGELD